MGCIFSSSSNKDIIASLIEKKIATRIEIETKIISLARGITNTVKDSIATDSKSGSVSNGTAIESRIEKSFKDIIALGKKSRELDGKVLNEVLIACNYLRINYSALAGKLAFISNTAKTLVEERTARTAENEDQGINLSGSTKGMNQIIVGQESHIPKNKDPEATLIIQIKPVKASKDSKLFELVERKLSSNDTGLPPLKDFSKKEDGSQHSSDFGFFDLSMHDSSLHEKKIRDQLLMPIKILPMKLQYSVTQLKTDGI